MVQLNKGTDKLLYKLWYGQSPCVIYFKLFRSRCYIKRDNHSWKFGWRRDEIIFLGYSTNKKDNKYFNKRTNNMIESENIRIDEYSKKNDEFNKREPKD